MQREHDQEAFIWALRRLSNEPVLLWNTSIAFDASNRGFLPDTIKRTKEASSFVSKRCVLND